MRRSLARATVVASLSIGLQAACYHYGVEKPASDPATVARSRTFHAIAWGLVVKPEVARAAECQSGTALDNVHVTTNVGYALLTTVTLGFWAPLKMEWQCTKPTEATGVIRSDSLPPQELER